MYFNGKGVKQDDGEAVRWIRKAADQGVADAEFNLGTIYEYGQGVQLEYAEAARWYRKAAEQGHGDAQFNLGVFYAHGKGVKQNHDEAARWYRKASHQGCMEATQALKRQHTGAPLAGSQALPTRVCVNCGIAEGSSGITQAVFAVQGSAILWKGLPGTALESRRSQDHLQMTSSNVAGFYAS